MTERIEIRADSRLVAALDRATAGQMVSRSAYVRMALLDRLRRDAASRRARRRPPMPDFDAEAAKIGPDFKQRQARLNEALFAKASTAEGFRTLEQLLGTQPKPAPVKVLPASLAKQSERCRPPDPSRATKT